MATRIHRRSFWSATLASVLGAAAFTAVSHAATINLVISDPSGTSSYNTGTDWADGNPPSAGNSYVVPTNAGASLQLRTPTASGSYTFGGHSLTIGDGNIPTSGQVRMTYSNVSQTLTINNLQINNGAIYAGSAGNALNVLNGNVTVTNTGTFDMQSGSRTLTINAPIGGTGAIAVSDATLTAAPGNNTTTTNPAGIVLATANSYSGGTTVRNGSRLIATADGALGTGNVTLAGTADANSILQADLLLQGGTTHQFISSSADLILPSNLATNAVNLNFTGSDVVAGVSFDGGTTFDTTPGTTFGAVGSGATITSADFTGTGLLSIAGANTPEPASICLISALATMSLAGRPSKTARRQA